MSTYWKNLLLLHLIVLIFGFTGIFGKLISIDSMPLVWYRMAIGAAGLLGYAYFKKKSLRVSWKTALQFAGVGVLVAAHWITFFASIKASNVSVALATISTASLFVALFEPLIAKTKIKTYELVLGLVVIAGLMIIYGVVDPKYYLGIQLSLVSAALAALFASFNGQLVKKHDSTKISFYELGTGMVVLFVFLAAQGKIDAEFFNISALDWGWLLILGLVCTSFAFVVSVEIVKALSVFTVSLSINMEPVYSIILALVIFKESEQMSTGFYLGALVILATLFANARLKQLDRRKEAAKSVQKKA